VKLTVKISPNAKKSEIIGFDNSILKIKIQAPPIDGKANEELVRFLSKEWNISKSKIQILKGESSKIKVLEVPNSVSLPPLNPLLTKDGID